MNLTYGQQLVETETNQQFTVSKYWADDNDPNAYKVRLIHRNTRMLDLSFYSSDLKSLIIKESFQINKVTNEN